MHTVTTDSVSPARVGQTIPPDFSSLAADLVLMAWPAARGFTGRSRDLKIAQYLLRKEKILVITGAFAVGKTALARQLGQSYPEDQRLWVKCEKLTNLSGLAYLIATQTEDRQLESFLKADRAKSYPSVVRVAWAVSRLMHWGGKLLCLDNAQAVVQDPEMRAFISSLASRIADGQSQLSLTVTTRQPLTFLSEFGYMELAGIEAESTSKLYGLRHLLPSELLAEQTHKMMGGSAGLIDHTAHHAYDLFVLPHVEEDKNPSDDPLPVDVLDLAEKPLKNPYIQGSLHENAFKDLTAAEKIVLYAIALFDEPVPPEWVKAAVEEEIAENASFVLYRLQSQGLVNSPSPFSELLTLTPVMRSFYREKVKKSRLLRRLHHNLADHFAWEGNIRQATEYYLDADESQQAADFLLQYADYTQDHDDRALIANLITHRLLDWPAVRQLSQEVKGKLEGLAATLQNATGEG